jgi:hypothetical protein
MCTEQVTPEHCYEYFAQLKQSIQCLYNNIERFIFQDIDFSEIIGLLPQWVCDGGRSPELVISKEEFERHRNLLNNPIVRRFIYYYDLWNIIAALQDRFEAVEMSMRDFYKIVPFKVKYHNSDYTSALRQCGMSETSTHISLNNLFVALASTFDLISKIAIEQAEYSKYGDFSKYSKMRAVGNDSLYNVSKLAKIIDGSLLENGMLFAKNRYITIVENFRNEYVHNGAWDFRGAVYYAFVNEESPDIIVFAPDTDEYGNFISYGSRNKFYSHGTMINVVLPKMLKSILEILKRTIDCLSNLYAAGITQTSEQGQIVQIIKDLNAYHIALQNKISAN